MNERDLNPLPALEGTPVPDSGWTGRSHGSRFAHRMLELIAGTWIFDLLSWPITLVYLLRLKSERRATASYWERIAPEHGVFWRFLQAWRQFRELGFALSDRLLAARRPERFQILDAEPRAVDLREALKENHGVILLTSHLGGWAMAAAMLRRMDFPVVVAMRDADEPSMRAYFAGLRDQENIRIVDLAEPGASIDLLGCLKANRVVCLMADRWVEGERGVEATFLGRTAKLPAGPYHLARLSNAPLMSAFAVREGKNRYRMIVSAPFRTEIEKAASQYAADLEAIVRQYPHQWFNFYDFWKK